MLHPSTRAASMSSKGRASSRYWVIQNTPKAVTRSGTMTAWRVPTQFSFVMTMNSGITPSCTGTAIVAMTNISRARRPRKRSLEKENPREVAKKTTEAEVIAETITEFPSARQKSMSEVTTFCRLCRRFPWGGISDGSGLRAMLPASDEASSSA